MLGNFFFNKNNSILKKICSKINVVVTSRATLKVNKKLQLLVFKLKSLLKLEIVHKNNIKLLLSN